jgi:hypothetical protein
MRGPGDDWRGPAGSNFMTGPHGAHSPRPQASGIGPPAATATSAPSALPAGVGHFEVPQRFQGHGRLGAHAHAVRAPAAGAPPTGAAERVGPGLQGEAEDRAKARRASPNAAGLSPAATPVPVVAVNIAVQGGRDLPAPPRGRPGTGGRGRGAPAKARRRRVGPRPRASLRSEAALHLPASAPPLRTPAQFFGEGAGTWSERVQRASAVISGTTLSTSIDREVKGAQVSPRPPSEPGHLRRPRPRLGSRTWSVSAPAAAQASTRRMRGAGRPPRRAVKPILGTSEETRTRSVRKRPAMVLPTAAYPANVRPSSWSTAGEGVPSDIGAPERRKPRRW